LSGLFLFWFASGYSWRPFGSPSAAQNALMMPLNKLKSIPKGSHTVMKKISLTIWRCALVGALMCLVGTAGRARDVAANAPHKVDEFTGANWESAMAHLDNFTLEMNNNPAEVGVIIVYGGSHEKRGEARAWSACIKDYLIKRRSIATERLIVIDGGYRKTLTAELWGAVDKTHLPAPSGQISLRDVRFKKGKIGPWRRMCSL